MDFRILAILTLFGLSGCGDPIVTLTDNRFSGPKKDESTKPGPEDPKPPTPGWFTRLSSEIFEPNCVKCHKPGTRKGRVDVSTYSAIMENPDKKIVLVNDPENSILVQVLKDGSMPDNGTPLTPEAIQKIVDWINLGAPENEAAQK